MATRNARSTRKLTIQDIQKIDFSQMAYRGYLVRRSAINGTMWIEKDGQLVYRVPVTESWQHARNVIDQLTGKPN